MSHHATAEGLVRSHQIHDEELIRTQPEVTKLRSGEEFEKINHATLAIEDALESAVADDGDGDAMTGVANQLDRQIMLSPPPTLRAIAIKLGRLHRWTADGAPIDADGLVSLRQILEAAKRHVGIL